MLSLPVVALTGTFIGMVLAVQSYSQFRLLHLETRLGAVINMSLVRELGPVLAATMLAGRVGSAMAAELGTMRVTEQIDALSSMGANPIQYLVVPRFLGLPGADSDADDHGRLHGRGGRLRSTASTVWASTRTIIGRTRKTSSARSICSRGVFKSLFFGAAIALISCHRGFHCDPGAEGVGRAADRAFVVSFVLILMLDFFLGIALDDVYTDDLARGNTIAVAGLTVVSHCRRYCAATLASRPKTNGQQPVNRQVRDRPAAGRAARGGRRVRPATRCCATSI